MSKIEVDAITQQSGTTLTTGGGAGKTVVVDATTVTLGRCGGTVALASGASQTGFGRTGTVDWQTGSIKTATFTAANGEGYFANTTGGAFTMNLPAGTAGNIVSVVDYTNTFQTNNLTISANGSEKIGGVAADFVASTEGQSLTFVYVDGTEGWKNVQDSTSNATGNPYLIASGGTETTCGDYKIHTFTGPGTFTVSKVAVTGSDNVVDYVVVAGGAGGGTGFSSGAGGGGGGGFRYYANTTTNPQACGPALPINNFPSGTSITVTATGFPIAVGGGGAGAPMSPPTKSVGTSGVNSTFSTVTSAGGGGGGSESPSSPIYTGAAGGSGGGGGYHGGSGGSGAGNTPPTSPAQGTAGGNFGGPSPGERMGGGGGGGIQAGITGNTSAPAPTRGNGGAGAGIKGFGTSGESCGSHYFFSGGGGGQSQFQPKGSGIVAQGGIGGGGNGSDAVSPAPSQAEGGTTNTGGGGGGQTPGASIVNGGSGIVIIRYKFQ